METNISLYPYKKSKEKLFFYVAFFSAVDLIIESALNIFQFIIETKVGCHNTQIN
jgi:hypothetical protein